MMLRKSHSANGVPSQPSTPTSPTSPTRDKISQNSDVFVEGLSLSPAHKGWSLGSDNIRAFKASSSESPSLSHQKIAIQGLAQLDVVANRVETVVLKTDPSEPPKPVMGSMNEGEGITVSNTKYNGSDLQYLPVKILDATKTPEKNEAALTPAAQVTIYHGYPVLIDPKSSLDSIHECKEASDRNESSNDSTYSDSKDELTDIFVSVTVEEIDRAADAVIPSSQCMTVSGENDIVFGIPAMVSSAVYCKLEKAEYVTGMLPYP